MGFERPDEEEREKEKARMKELREHEERERQQIRDKLNKEMEQKKSGKQDSRTSETPEPGTHAEAIERARKELGIESNDPLSRAFLERYVKAEERDRSLQDLGEDAKLRNPEAWKDSLDLAKLLSPDGTGALQERLANRILGTAILRDMRLDTWGIRDLLASAEAVRQVVAERRQMKDVPVAEGSSDREEPSKQQRETPTEKGVSTMKIEEFQTTKVADYVAKPSEATLIEKVEFKQLSPEQKKEQQWQETKEKMKTYLRTRGYKVDGPWEVTQGYGVLNMEFNLQRHWVEASGKFTPEELKQMTEYLGKVAEDVAKQTLRESFSTAGTISKHDGRSIPDVVVRRERARWLQGLDNLLHAYDQIAALGGVVPGGVSGRGRTQRMPGETAWGSPLKPEAVRQHVERVERPLEAPPRMPEAPPAGSTSYKKIQRPAETAVMPPFEKADTIRMPGSDKRALAPDTSPGTSRTSG